MEEFGFYIFHRDFGMSLLVFLYEYSYCSNSFYGSVSTTNNNRDDVGYQVVWNNIPASQAASRPILCVNTMGASSDILYCLNENKIIECCKLSAP